LNGASLREIRERAAGKPTAPPPTASPVAAAPAAAPAAADPSTPTATAAQGVSTAAPMAPAPGGEPALAVVGAAAGSPVPNGISNPSAVPSLSAVIAATLEERARDAPDLELQQLRTTALIRECLSRGIRRVRTLSLLQALRDDLAQIERLIG
jgi:hypothetical protein